MSGAAMRGIILATLLAVHISGGTAAEVWVDAGVSSSGDGSEISPYKTIQEGVTNVTDGGTVHLAAGVYAQSTTIADKSVILLGPGNPDSNVVLDLALAASVTGTDNAHTFTIEHTTGGGAVTIQNLQIGGEAGYDAIRISGTNCAAVNLINCDFVFGPSNAVHLVAGDGNGPVTIRWCNFGIDASGGNVGVRNDDTDVSVQASGNWWNSYLGSGMDETYDSTVVRYAATTESGAGTVDVSSWMLGRLRFDSESDGENDNSDIDDDNDTATDKGEIAVGTDPSDNGSTPATPLPPDVYVNSAWSANDLGDTVGNDYTYGYDAFAEIQEAIYGVRDNE